MKNRLTYNLFILSLLCSLHVSFGAIQQNPESIKRFDDDFKSRYQSDKYDYQGAAIVTQTPSGSGKYESYKNNKFKPREENNTTQYSINLEPLNWFFYLAIIIAIIALVYILFNEGGSGLFSSKRHQSINTYNDITANNIEDVDILSHIEQAENAQNYRLAIRYYYLHVLKTLSINKHIKFEDDKTNSEYLNETSNKPFSAEFAYISYLYNYIWYGEFPLALDQYNKAKSNFSKLLNQLN